MSSVRPNVRMPVEVVASEYAPHYGVLMGGAKELLIEGVGEQAVGHLSIPRRALAEFVRIQVGLRNESEAALNDSSRSIQWFNNPERIGNKSPRECARDVFATFGDRGFIIPASLIGKSFDEAINLFNEVMPKADSLVEVIKGLTSVSFEGEKERLRQELLDGANTAYAYISRYATEVANEVANAPKTGKGKGGFDDLDKEYFRELNKPLPEEVPAIATLAMGKEIAASLNASKAAGSNDELLKALMEQNALLMQHLTDGTRQAPVAAKEPALKSKKAAEKQEG